MKTVSKYNLCIFSIKKKIKINTKIKKLTNFTVQILGLFPYVQFYTAHEIIRKYNTNINQYWTGTIVCIHADIRLYYTEL